MAVQVNNKGIDMKKEEWITAWTTGKWESANKDVITFIANILYHSENGKDNSEVIYGLFGCGYCYYFALMLQNAFNRGSIMWHTNHGHIVWLDVDGAAYDIGGVFYDYNEGDLSSISDLGDDIENFKHVDKTI